MKAIGEQSSDPGFYLLETPDNLYIPVEGGKTAADQKPFILSTPKLNPAAV